MVIKAPVKRAVSEVDKAGRQDKILAAAADAFDRLGFAATSMSWLAERSGVAKGTLYLYFPTKEAVFLALYRRELDDWLAGIDSRLERMPAGDIGAFAGIVADSLEVRPRLPALAAILHVVLERNAGEEELLTFRRHMKRKMSATGEALEARLDFLLPGDGSRLMFRVHALVIGCWHAAGPAPMARRILKREEFAALRVDFHEELENALVLLLEGWRHGGGGF